jgi:hypothetical protein
MSSTNNKSNLLIKPFDIENGLLGTERDTFLLLLYIFSFKFYFLC